MSDDTEASGYLTWAQLLSALRKAPLPRGLSVDHPNPTPGDDQGPGARPAVLSEDVRGVAASEHLSVREPSRTPHLLYPERLHPEVPHLART